MNISKPTLLIDLEKVRINIARIAEKGRLSKTVIIPHFKTHQSLNVGKIFKDSGIDAITVSSVSMARYFANAGWYKIYIAFPVNVLELSEINDLAKTTELTLLVNNLDHTQALINKLTNAVKLKIEIECGSDRSGLDPDNLDAISLLLNEINKSKHSFDGFYSHFGHTYRAESPKDVKAIYEKSIQILYNLKERYAHLHPKVSTGDTPSASVIANFNELDSVHAGNFVFYDLTQAQIGVCNENDIAIALASPVVSKNKEKKELVIYGGGIHLSKENMTDRELGVPIYGKLVKLTDSGWSDSLEGCYLRSISQEHGIAKVTGEIFDEIGVGDLIGVLPVHSCMTADCMRQYRDMKGEFIDHLQGLGI